VPFTLRNIKEDLEDIGSPRLAEARVVPAALIVLRFTPTS
jgi:hypothetical protein